MVLGADMVDKSISSRLAQVVGCLALLSRDTETIVARASEGVSTLVEQAGQAVEEGVESTENLLGRLRRIEACLLLMARDTEPLVADAAAGIAEMIASIRTDLGK